MDLYLAIYVVVAVVEFIFFFWWVRTKYKVKVRKNVTTIKQVQKRVGIFMAIIFILVIISLIIILYCGKNNPFYGCFAIPACFVYILIGMTTLTDKLEEYKNSLIKIWEAREKTI